MNEWIIRYGWEVTDPGTKRILETSYLAGDGYFYTYLQVWLECLNFEVTLSEVDPQTLPNWVLFPQVSQPPNLQSLQSCTKCLCHRMSSSSFPLLTRVRKLFWHQSLRETFAGLFIQAGERLIILQAQLPEKTSYSSGHSTVSWHGTGLGHPGEARWNHWTPEE